MDFPQLPTQIQEINRRLIDEFGIDTEGTGAIWRVSWSKDQTERRVSEFTRLGVQLLTPEVMELPKYDYIRPACWLLEQLTLVPEVHEKELAGAKKSYECMYAFHEITPIPPSFEACKFIIDVVNAAKGKSSLKKYIDEEMLPEAHEARIEKITEELFGDESSLLGRTITGEAVAYTGEPKISASQKEH